MSNNQLIRQLCCQTPTEVIVVLDDHSLRRGEVIKKNKKKSGEPSLVDRVLALHAGSRGFDSHRGHVSERFFRSNGPGYPHPVSSELGNSGIRVAVGELYFNQGMG